MKVIVIIQARMGSKRFPGKSLCELNGKPVLGHVVDAIAQVIDRKFIYIATSDQEESQAIVDYCNGKSLNVFSGDEEKVASRFFEIAKSSGADYFIRISGDSPLLDPGVIEMGLAKLDNDLETADLITTVSDRPFPSGMNMEIVNSATFNRAYSKFSTSDHFEHVTKYYYENKSEFKIGYLESEIDDAASYKFSFDTEEDLKKIEGVFAEMNREHYTYSLQEKCAIYNAITANLS